MDEQKRIMDDDNQILNNSKLLNSIRKKKSVQEKLEKIKKYLNQGADINTIDRNDNDNTPLHIAVRKQELEIVRFLLERGATVDVKNGRNESPFNLADQLLDDAKKQEIIKVLKIHEEKQSSLKSIEDLSVDSPVSEIDKQSNIIEQHYYEKRSGTAGLSGQLYETKLSCLILFRGLTNKQITQFYLGTNVKGLGNFDDIVFRYDVTNQSKPKIIFLQAKHKDNINKNQLCHEKVFNESGDFSLLKYFESYLDIKEKFNKSDSDIFNDAFENIDSYFVIFTSASENFVKKKCFQPNEILFTKETGMAFQVEYEVKDIDVLEKIVIKRCIKKLGVKLVEFIFENNKSYTNMMSDKLIKKYHVILARDVFELHKEDENQNYYNGKFKETFLNNNDDKLLLLLKETLYDGILKDKTKLLVSEMSNNLSLETISKIIGCEIMYDSEQKEFIHVDKAISNGISKLKNHVEKINITESVIEAAIKIARKNEMKTQTFKLPLVFGNLDLKIRKNKQIDRLVEKFIDIFTDHEITINNIVNIHDHMLNSTKKLNKGDLQVNGGIGGLIGNLLILDKKTMMFKFNDNPESLPKVAKELYGKLKEETLKRDKMMNSNFESYRFIIQVDDLPRLSFNGEENDKYLVKDFLNKLYFYTSQAKEYEVEQKLLQEINDYNAQSNQSESLFKLKNEAIFLKAHDMVQKWWKQVGKAPYLTKRCKFFNEAVAEFIDKPLLSILHYILLKDIKKYEIDIQFNNDAIKTLKIDEFIKSNKQTLSIHTESCKLSNMKLLQYFKDKGLNYLFINLNYVLKIQFYDKVIYEITNTEFDVLIIEIMNCDADKNINRCTQKICEDMKKILCKKSSARLIIVSDDYNIFTREFNDFSNNPVEDKDNNFENLDESTQNKLLREKVIFQGKKIILATIFNKNLKHISVEELLRHVCGDVQISREVPRLDEVKYYYVDRVFTRCLTLRDTSLEYGIKKENLFFISGVEKGGLSYLNNDEIITDFDNYPNHNIHWLNKENESLKWKKSYGNLSAVRERIDNEKIQKYMPKTITDIDDQIVILTAEPGMGKSTVLSYLANQLDPTIWTVRINLNDCTQLFSKANFENDIETINFILDVLKLKSSVEKELLQYELTCRGNIILLIDGFDEICPIYEKKVLNLLRVLKSKKASKLWITTRLNMREKVEDELSTLAYTLEPLSTVSQKEFLQKFWTWKLGNQNINEKRLILCCEALLQHVSELITDNRKNIFGVVFHLQMLAEAFENEFKKFYNDTGCKTFSNEKKFNLLELYDVFVEKKYDLYKKEKMRQDNTNAAVINNSIKLHDCFIQNHENAAVYTLFKDHEYFNNLISKNEIKKIKNFIEEIRQGIENTGIIYNVIDNKPNFIHRTFAEYFAANWLANNVDNKEIKSFLLENIFLKDHKLLREFFDYKLAADSEVHTAVLNGDEKKLIDLLKANRNLINTVDRAGRRLLHLAALYGHAKIVLILVHQEVVHSHRKFNIDVADQLFKWSPSRYAMQEKHWQILDFFCYCGTTHENCGNKDLMFKVHGLRVTLGHHDPFF